MKKRAIIVSIMVLAQMTVLGLSAIEPESHHSIPVRASVTYRHLNQTVYPTADCEVDSFGPDTNYNSSASLDVHETRYRSYLRWNLTAPGVGAWISDAQLWLYKNDDTQYGINGVQIYDAMTPVWGETKLTWNNRPVLNESNYITTVDKNTQEHIWVDMASAPLGSTLVESHIKAQFNATGRVGIGLNQSEVTNPNTHKTYLAKESSGTQYDPYLYLHWVWAAPPLITWTSEIVPKADSWVSQLMDDFNYGSDTTMHTQKQPTIEKTYLRWNLTEGDILNGTAIPVGAWVQAAELHIYKQQEMYSGTPRTTTIWHYGANDWGENSLTWNTRPTYNEFDVLSGIVETTYGWQTYNTAPFTNEVLSQYNATSGEHVYLALQMETTGGAVATNIYSSKEGIHAPHLVVTWWHPSYEYSQPGGIEVPIDWSAEYLSSSITTAMSLIGFAGMMVCPALLVSYWKEEGLQGFATVCFIFTLCFGLFWAGMSW